ncbi:MAG: hypothetical protein EYC68_01235 [Chloroflexota bacterium]|nr:MAG: hypothetical protein EYC68_01235 [Chloroflexota bacterium]
MNDERAMERVWDARHFVYAFWVEHTHPPTVQDTANGLGIELESVRALYEELGKRHALLLMPGTHSIRMAWPFSGVPTGYRVRVGTQNYYANCAWDSFGIPAALHADAQIDAFCSNTQEPLHFTVRQGKISGDSAVIYFRIPFANWYDDLVFT